MSSMPLTEGLAAFVHAPGFTQVPEDLRPALRNGFVDTVACVLSGRAEPVTQAALALAGEPAPSGRASVLFGSARLRDREAAFVNAVSGHALDYDDMAVNGHPSVVLVPALLAVGQSRGAADADLLRAYLVGYEVWAELMSREPDSLHNKGWHPTSVLGTVAVAAAVAHLDQLSAPLVRNALGIAASMASGLMGNFGSMTKPLHAGWAAQHGIEAVRLAQAGATSTANVLESATGYLAAFSPQGHSERGPFSPPAELRFRTNGLSVKKYPVCYAGHRVIDGAIALKRAHGLQPAQIVRIEATLSDVTARVLHEHTPQTALQAKFSLEFACAMALCEGQVGLTEVTDAQVRRADVQALMQRVQARTVEAGCPIEPGFALHDQVKVTLTDGRELDSGPIRFARGHAQQPLTLDDLRTKFRGCVSAGERAWAERLLQRLERLGEGSGPSLCDSLSDENAP